MSEGIQVFERVDEVGTGRGNVSLQRGVTVNIQSDVRVELRLGEGAGTPGREVSRVMSGAEVNEGGVLGN